jgi:hypothetical protein
MRVKFVKPEEVTFADLAIDSDINISDGCALAKEDNSLGHFYWWKDATQKLNWATPGNHQEDQLLAKSLRDSMAREDAIDSWLENNFADQFMDSRNAYALRHNDGVISMLRRNKYPLL